MTVSKCKKKIATIAITNILIFSTIGMSFADSKKVIYKENNTIVYEDYIIDDSDRNFNLISDYGEYEKINESEISDSLVYDVKFKKFENIDFQKPYVILRDQSYRVLKAYNIIDTVYNNTNLKNDKLEDRYILESPINIQQKVTNIILKDKVDLPENIDGKIKIKIKYKLKDTVVKEENLYVEKGNKPEIKEFEYQGKIIKINKLLLPNVEKEMTLTIPIDSAYEGVDQMVEDFNNALRATSPTMNKTVEISPDIKISEVGNDISITNKPIMDLIDENIMSQPNLNTTYPKIYRPVYKKITKPIKIKKPAIKKPDKTLDNINKGKAPNGKNEETKKPDDITQENGLKPKEETKKPEESINKELESKSPSDNDTVTITEKPIADSETRKDIKIVKSETTESNNTVIVTEN